ncbi:IS110 family transposase [Pedococcus sp. 5OH_020]|uniref:IS110 family transposase n=1 Tax=Pedococcus sp. 5OH_020 TaxID=2989814 RepID=UPI0022E9A1FE|nr:IS110 family transposase [Pedococcus sp. 5OH_020]
MQRWCGIDWAEHHHDIAIVDEAGALVTKVRIEDTAAGFSQLMDLLAVHNDGCETPIPVAIETAKGLLVANLRAAGVSVYAINPLSVARYRDRHAPSRSKSDAADALVLANIVRTDPTVHRLIPQDSELAASIRVLARAHQDAIWDRQQTVGKLRSVLREYYPGVLATFEDLSSREARATLMLAPSPATVSKLRPSSLAAALRRAGRSRYVDRDVEKILTGLRAAQLRQPALVEKAMAAQASAYVRALTTLVENIQALQEQLEIAYHAHPDSRIISSFPGLGTVLGARILSEIGDDHTRFATARGLKAFAGTAPITRASGTKKLVTMRVVRNKRLGQAAYLWSLPLLAHSHGARAHYDRRRAAGDSHSAASRHLANRGLGMLHHCLTTGSTYNESHAFPSRTYPSATSRSPMAHHAYQEAEAPTTPAQKTALP